MKLIGSLSSPFVRKVRIVLAEKKLDYQLQLEDVWADGSVIHSLNPLGKVPCLVMDDDTPALYDSRVIVEYLDTLSPVSRLLPAAGRERLEIKWWEAVSDGVLDAAVLIRLEHTQRSAEHRSDAWLARQRGKIEAALPVMDNRLGDRPHCVGMPTSSYSLADIAVGCALGYLDFRLPDLAWRDNCPNLARLYEKLQQRQSFIDTQPA
ncbi:MAG: glutathione S-transferase N-terminal domain-containing protein [Pigmentiphaga sp.]|nr:glutathione S-transferase N-terminal domain-containing protein [Pigmentiphaga sp.]